MKNSILYRLLILFTQVPIFCLHPNRMQNRKQNENNALLSYLVMVKNATVCWMHPIERLFTSVCYPNVVIRMTVYESFKVDRIKKQEKLKLKTFSSLPRSRRLVAFVTFRFIRFTWKRSSVRFSNRLIATQPAGARYEWKKKKHKIIIIVRTGRQKFLAVFIVIELFFFLCWL